MPDIRKLISVTLAAVLVCALTGYARGQDTDADQARDLLKRGLDQFQARQYDAARKTLTGLAEDAKLQSVLSEEQKKQLNDCLEKVTPAVDGQARARAAIDAGDAALKGNKLALAEQEFNKAAASEYLTDAEKKAVQDRMALLKDKIAALAQAQQAESPAAVAQAPAEPAAPAPTAPAPAVPAAPAPTAPAPGTQVAPRSDIPEPITSDILADYERKRLILKGKAEYDIAEALKRANEVLAKAASASEFDAAAAAVNVAQNVLNGAKPQGLFMPNELGQRQDEIDRARQFVDAKRNSWERETYVRMRKEIAEADAERIRREQDTLRKQVVKYTADVQAAIRLKDYKKALSLTDMILNIDPQNQAIRDQRAVLEQVELLQREKGFAADAAYHRQQQLVDIREAEIPWYELLRYPKDWREITARREPFVTTGAAETEQNRLALQKLKRVLKDVKFEDLEFKNVVEWLQTVSALSIHVKWTSLETAGINQQTKVKSVHLSDVTVEKALRTVLDDIGGTNPLTFIIDEGVLTISTRDDLSGERYRTTMTYDVSDLIVTVPNFVGPRLEMNISANNQNATQQSPFNIGTFQNVNNNANDRNMLFNELMNRISRTVDRNSWAEPWGTGMVGSMGRFGDQLIITQTAENQRAIMDLLTKLREAKSLQITIECRFLSVNTGFLNSIGLDLQTFFNIGSTLGGGGTVVDPSTGALVPLRGPSGWQMAGSSGIPKSFQNVPPLALRQDTMAWATQGLASPISAGIASIGSTVTTPSLSIGGTFLDDIQVDFLIQATQANQYSRSVTAPRITIYNGQRSYVTFATQQAYVSDLTPFVAENVVAYRPTVAFVPTGTVLDVEGTVSADRRYVIMTVRPQISQLNGFTIYATSGVWDPNTGATAGVGFIQLPNVTLQDLQTTISVPDGGTLLLGGQKASGELEREKGAPLLSKIPLINRLFTNRAKVRDEQTILILIKPKIIIHRETEEDQFPGIVSRP